MSLTPSRCKIQKTILRAAVNKVKISMAVRRTRSRKICLKIQKSHFFKDAKTIGFYAALPDEIDVLSAGEKALLLGKKVFFPKMNHQHIEFFEVADFKNDLKPGKHGVMEPVSNKGTQRKRALDLVLVPGRSFDKKGGRLGRGGGYYDRLLEKWADSVRIGICFREQIVRAVPREAHDIVMDAVIAA